MMIGLVGSSSSCGTLWPFLEDLCADAATSSKDFTSEAHHLIFQTPVWGKLCVANDHHGTLMTHTDLKSS